MITPRRKLLLAAVGIVAALGVAGAANATATTDPPAEANREVAYTKAHLAEASVSQAAAETTATQLHPGTVIDAHLESEDHGLVWEIKPDDGTTIWEVQLDAHTGAVVSDQASD